MKIPSWIRGKAPASDGLSGTQKIRTSDKGVITVNDEGLTFEEWLAAAGVENNSVFSFVPKIEHVEAWENGEDPTEWRARGGKTARGWKVKDDLDGADDRRPFHYTIASDDWDEAARHIIRTINGVGIFQFDNLQDALDSGPYSSSKEFVLKHLHHLKDYYRVYRGTTIRARFDRLFR